jgi:hypothetical protein
MEETASNVMKNSTINYTKQQVFDMLSNNELSKISTLKEQVNNCGLNILYDYLFENIVDNTYFTYTFKNHNQYDFFKNFLINFRLEKDYDFTKIVEKKSWETPYSLYHFVMSLIRINKCQHLLRLFDFERCFNSLTDDQQYEVYFDSGIHSTLPVFLIISELIKEKNYTDFKGRTIVSAACRNADIRVMKYIFDNYHDYSSPTWSNENFINNLFNNVFVQHIPLKYILRRVKIMSSKINLVPYFNQMINVYCNTISDIDGFLTLKKYYGNNFKPESKEILNIVGMLTVYSTKENMLKILDFLDTNSRILFLLFFMIEHKTLKGIDYCQYAKTSDNKVISNPQIEEKVYSLVNSLILYDDNEVEIKQCYKEYKQILSLYKLDAVKAFKYGSIPSFKILYVSPLADFILNDKSSLQLSKTIFKQLLMFNRIKFHIKIWLRKTKKLINFENKVKKLLLEENVNIDNKSISKQKFTKLPPRHILPYELDLLTKSSRGKYIIREKADGTLVDFISTDTTPTITRFYDYKIKAEFIEDLDLYLLIDIDIDGMSITERYDFIRGNHPSTSDSLPILESKQIETFQDLKDEISKERQKFEEFLKLPYDNYRLYPKAAWIVNASFEFNKDIINNIINEEDSDLICNDGPYQNDGLIITPMDGNRELKIKPKHQHTIDLLYNGRSWVDREGNSWSHIITNKEKSQPNTIWRCYPTFEQNEDGCYLFSVGEFRYDKQKPNNNKVVNIIYKLHSIDWSNHDSLGVNFFYHDTTGKSSKSWNLIRDIQKGHLENVLNNIIPVIKSSWLDLGCGSSKLLEIIKKYHFDEYVGVDFDINQLLKGMRRIDSNQYLLNNCRIIPEDLNKDWNTHPMSWDIFNTEKKFDYLVANFSISHFYGDKLWEKLEQVSKSGTKFIFNVVNKEAINRWSQDGSYLYLDGDTIKYQFNSVHSEEMTEKYVTSELIEKDYTKFNWRLISCVTPTGSNIDSKYTWYVLEHN